MATRARAHHAKGNAHDLAALRGGVAVVTGAANGIGYALAEAALAHGMHAVLADVDPASLRDAEARLRGAAAAPPAGAEVFAHVTDVASEESVRGLAAAVGARFPGVPVSLLCCNAGTGGGGILSPHADWARCFGVNVFGPAHCIRAFVPGMLKQKAPGAVVTTASQDGICASQGVYGVSKHAAVALSEGLLQELRGALSVHVLCPHVTATKVFSAAALRGEGSERERRGAQFITDGFKKYGSPPSKMADMVFDAVRTGAFYIFGENDLEPGFVRRQAEVRMRAMLDGTLPYRPQSAIFPKIFTPPPKRKPSSSL